MGLQKLNKKSNFVFSFRKVCFPRRRKLVFSFYGPCNLFNMITVKCQSAANTFFIELLKIHLIVSFRSVFEIREEALNHSTLQVQPLSTFLLYLFSKPFFFIIMYKIKKNAGDQCRLPPFVCLFHYNAGINPIPHVHGLS